MDSKKYPDGISVEPFGLRISVPRNGFTEQNMTVLRQMLLSKGKLIQKALGANSLDVILTEDRVVFPWFSELPQHLDIQACLCLISALYKRAASGKPAPQLRDHESERYTFNRFLTTLELDGPKYQSTRKELMKKLSGTGPFPDKAAADAYYRDRGKQRQNDVKSGFWDFECAKCSPDDKEY